MFTVVMLFLALYSAMLSYMLFRGTMNLFQYFGPVYWVVRDNGVPGNSFVSFRARAWQLSPPWKQGNGVQFRLGTHTFQFGICKNGVQTNDEFTGVMNVLEGRELGFYDESGVYHDAAKRG